MPDRRPDGPDVVTVRYFAGAAEAAGCEEESLDAATVLALYDAMTDAHGPALARVLARCAVLVDGVRAGEQDAVPPGAVVDVLPPFAGG